MLRQLRFFVAVELGLGLPAEQNIARPLDEGELTGNVVFVYRSITKRREELCVERFDWVFELRVALAERAQRSLPRLTVRSFLL